MPLNLLREDLIRQNVDAIVNAANRSLLGGGGVDGAIHRAAGPELLAECRALGGCETGDCKVTRGCRLRAKWVIHAVGPVWRGGGKGEEALLRSCYRRALEEAVRIGCRSVAFPLISAGAYGYPKGAALRVAVDEISGFLLREDLDVRLCVLDPDVAWDVREADPVLSDLIAELDAPWTFGFPMDGAAGLANVVEDAGFADKAPAAAPASGASRRAFKSSMPFSDDDLARRLERMDEGFSGMLLKLIDARGMTDAECYRRANVDRRLFSKIRSDPAYRPSKPTVLAFCVALRLSPEETRALLARAGYALSGASRFDVIVEYCIDRGIYDVGRINEALFAYDQSLLGGQ